MTNWWDKAVKEYTDKLDAERKERAESLREKLRDVFGMQTNPDSGVVCLEYENGQDLYATTYYGFNGECLLLFYLVESSYGIVVNCSRPIYTPFEAGEALINMGEWLSGTLSNDMLNDLLYSYPSFTGKTFLDET